MSIFDTSISDLTHLEWAVAKGSPGTPGTLLKSEDYVDGKHLYYKLSSFDFEKGEIGHESVNELIVSRLLDLLGFEHTNYDLLTATVRIQSREYLVHPCVSADFRASNEYKVSFEDFYNSRKQPLQTPLWFCRDAGWAEQLNQMLVCDYVILNRDRHSANVEVLIDRDTRNTRLAPLYDHGLSLVFACPTDESLQKFDVHADLPVQAFGGGMSTAENLKYIPAPELPSLERIRREDIMDILHDLPPLLGKARTAKISEMLTERIHSYEILRVSRQRGREQANRSVPGDR